MKTKLLPALLCAIASGAPIDFTTGIATGVSLNAHNVYWNDGLIFTYPIPQYIANKSYTAQIVPTGSTTEKSEAYQQFDPNNKDVGFGSAFSDGRGALEVGVSAFNFARGVDAAISRYYTTIKNNTDEEIGFDFYYVIPTGKLEILGTRFPYVAAHARVEANIDYLLRTPDGGTYVDSTGSLLRFWADLTNEGRQGTFDRSSNVTVSNLSDDRDLVYTIHRYEGRADLPMIPAYGELTVYYDMYALFSSIGMENLGSAFIGDPTQLVQREGASFVPDTPAGVPEPATFLLSGLALVGVAALRRRNASSGRRT
jgi:hypothetical protein